MRRLTSFHLKDKQNLEFAYYTQKKFTYKPGYHALASNVLNPSITVYMLYNKCKPKLLFVSFFFFSVGYTAKRLRCGSYSAGVYYTYKMTPGFKPFTVLPKYATKNNVPRFFGPLA